MESNKPTMGGQVVRDVTTGLIGVTTDAPSRRTSQIHVSFIGQPYSVRASVNDLVVIELIETIEKAKGILGDVMPNDDHRETLNELSALFGVVAQHKEFAPKDVVVSKYGEDNPIWVKRRDMPEGGLDLELGIKGVDWYMGTEG